MGIGEEVLEHLKSADSRLGKVIEEIGKTPCTVSKWCNNSVQPDLNTLDKIAKLLDVDVKDLLNSTEK